MGAGAFDPRGSVALGPVRAGDGVGEENRGGELATGAVAARGEGVALDRGPEPDALDPDGAPDPDACPKPDAPLNPARASSIGMSLPACTIRSNPISRCSRGWSELWRSRNIS